MLRDRCRACGFGQQHATASYFDLIFGEDKERQRRYLKAILSEDRVTLSVGNRVMSAMMQMNKLDLNKLQQAYDGE